MSNALNKLCNDYCDGVVNEFIAAVFDLPAGPGQDKVYSWRKMPEA